MAWQFEGYVIVSADGMLAGPDNIMPASLKFDADQAFFSGQLDRASLLVHGRNSFEDQLNSPERTRIILTRSVTTPVRDLSQPKATLWNPAHAPFEAALEASGARPGIVAVIGGPSVFAMFARSYDAFFLSHAHRVTIRDGHGAFPGIPPESPAQVLTGWGLTLHAQRTLDGLSLIHI